MEFVLQNVEFITSILLDTNRAGSIKIDKDCLESYFNIVTTTKDIDKIKKKA